MAELNALGARETYEAFPVAGVAGARFALQCPQPSQSQGVRKIGWQTLFNGTMTAVSLALQGAYEDVDGEYVTLDTSTQVAGEMRIIEVRCKFVRIVVTSYTLNAATALITKILG